MAPTCCFNSLPTSISHFISNQTYLSMLEKNCTSMKDLKQIHAQLIKTGLAKHTIAASRILAFCSSKQGDINYAYLVFTQIENPNHFVWNSIIRGFSQSYCPQKSISLFIDMLFSSTSQPQRLTYPSVFKAYAQLGLACEGGQLHGRVIKLGFENDPFIRNTILYMYANCGFISEAIKVFDRVLDFDVVAWNTMIMGLAKCRLVDESRILFDKLLTRNSVSWNSMISGYVRNGRFFDALELFKQMQQEKIKPSEFTMVSLLNACASLGAIKQGEWIHDYIIKNKFELNAIVATAIIDMYSKCGSIDKARQVFDNVPIEALSCWNSIIIGLAMNGQENEALHLFSFLESSNLKPDYVSFIGVLTACNHSGMVDKAKDYFLLMKDKYKIEPTIKHYGCMVDVLGRAGIVEEAEELIRNMHIEPDAIIWGSLLWSCCKYGNIEIAKRAAKRLIELDPSESSSFVLMANALSSSSYFEEAIKHRLYLKEKQIEKRPGTSLIEVNGEVHEFVAGGKLHPRTKEIYYVLDHSVYGS
ncbi:pentatricopeptide repeat-containing protein At2g42920, chloroplastic [Mercurialis annua]|uniref:pentatricopeptide repeat-containing protein At2g42920, chloroplastic n=1 Tax=Mercurialis annua TaxID=3986 RepID=UPI00215F0455|nr:pentatricopeptide repeat-containing protein At2g42920, chloroplastic [Mercurialis annua]